MELSYDSQEELIANTCEESIESFVQLEGAKFIVALRLPISNLANSVLKSIKMPYYPDSVFSRSLIVSSVSTQLPLIEIVHVGNEVMIKSFKFNCDEPAIWIGNKLEKYLKVNIIVRDPEKIKEAKNQPKPQDNILTREKEIIREKEVIVKIRCPYCKNPYPETLDKCPYCGARA